MLHLHPFRDDLLLVLTKSYRSAIFLPLFFLLSRRHNESHIVALLLSNHNANADPEYIRHAANPLPVRIRSAEIVTLPGRQFEGDTFHGLPPPGQTADVVFATLYSSHPASRMTC